MSVDKNGQSVKNNLFQIILYKEMDSRVDVSETFSADQLWFRILSGLFQRCSLPENLWTALIQLWTALKTEFFRAKIQRWNRAVSALIFSEAELIFSETALKHQIFRAKLSALNHQIFRAKLSALNQCCFSADFLWNRAEQRWFSLTQRWKTKKPEQEKSALSQSCFSADFPWKRADTHWSLHKQLSSFLIFPWDNAEHPETSYSFSGNFCRKAQTLSFPGKLENLPLWQKKI